MSEHERANVGAQHRSVLLSIGTGADEAPDMGAGFRFLKIQKISLNVPSEIGELGVLGWDVDKLKQFRRRLFL